MVVFKFVCAKVVIIFLLAKFEYAKTAVFMLQNIKLDR